MRLEELFARTKDARSVHISSKKQPYEDGSVTHAILFRVTDGGSKERAKFSTLVPPSDILAFQDTYLTTLRTHLAENLKKRDKAKERRVDKTLAASRKKLEENDGKVKILGAKRGKGRRQRMRALRRARILRQARAQAQHPPSATQA